MIFFLSFISFAIGISCSTLSRSLLGIEIALVLVYSILLLGGWRRWYIFSLITFVAVGGWYLGRVNIESRELSFALLSAETRGFSGTYTIRGTAEKLLYTSDLSSTYRLRIDTIANTSTQKTPSLQEKNIGILFEIPNNLHINTGDTVEYRGKIMPILQFPLEGFSRYAWYHQAYGKSVVPLFQRITITEPSTIASLQLWAKTVLFRGFPENIAGIILGMTLGNGDLLSSETKKSFTNAGITHILVVSGSNIAFVIVILTGILRYFPIRRLVRIGSVVVFVLLYGAIVGWDMPVIRAVSMGLITYASLEGGKRASSLALLFLIGSIILIYSPLALLYDAGFGLSFAGTLGILLFHRPIGVLLTHRYMPQFLIDIISVTIAASIGSMVAIIYHFGNIPVYTLVSNLLISGILGWILFSGVVYLFLAIIGGWILYLWGWVLYIPTVYILWVGNYFGETFVYSLDKEYITPISLFLIGLLTTSVFILEKRSLLESK